MINAKSFKLAVITMIIVGIIVFHNSIHVSEDEQQYLRPGNMIFSSTKSCQNPNKKSIHSVIVHLKTNDKIITIISSSLGHFFTIKTENGKILAVKISKQELQAKFPDLKNIVDYGIAIDAGINPRYLWFHQNLSHQPIF